MPKTPKRPRDLNQWAKPMVDVGTCEASVARRHGDANARARGDE